MVFKCNHQNRPFSLSEASRKDLITKSRQGSRVRYDKRLNYQVANFRGVDLDKFFNDDYFVYETPVNDYIVTLAFPGVLTELRDVVKVTDGDVNKITYRLVLKALRIAFDKTQDVKVRCTCPDFKYRFCYWALRNKYLYGPPIPGTEKFPKDTNPDDALGAVCKHLDLFLSNKRWLVKAASVVTSLIKTYPKKAATYLYDPEDIKPVEDELPEEPEEVIDDTEEVEEVPENEIEDEESTEEVEDEIEDNSQDEDENTED